MGDVVRVSAPRLVVAPAQWVAHHVGAELTLRDPAAARIAELERELATLRRAA